MRPGAGELAAFLRARRMRLPSGLTAPESNGSGARGMTREELATRASISVPYLTRLEQGRARNPSDQVVDSLGQALGLDHHGLDDLRLLAGRMTREPTEIGERLQPALRALVSSVDTPAAIVGRYADVLAANLMARKLDLGLHPGNNLLRYLFVDPLSVERLLDWEPIARFTASQLRLTVAKRADDSRLSALMRYLYRQSPAFRSLWEERDLGARLPDLIRFEQPDVGRLALHLKTFPVPDMPGVGLAIYYPEPGSADEASLTLLRGGGSNPTAEPTGSDSAGRPGPERPERAFDAR